MAIVRSRHSATGVRVSLARASITRICLEEFFTARVDYSSTRGTVSAGLESFGAGPPAIIPRMRFTSSATIA